MVAKFTTKARESMFSNLVQHHITDNTTTLNALDFVESPQGLNIKLYPVQRVLLKLIFGIPMDMDEHEVPVYDIFCEHLLYTFKETEYIKYVHEQGRINLTDWQSAPPEGYNEVVAVVGRRGGKAVSLDTPVPTPAGFIPMGDLKVGDFVYSPTGATTKIIQAHQPFTDQTYRVGFDDGTSVVCHGGHLWHTLSKNERKNNARRWPNTGPRPQMCKGISAGSVKTTLEIMNTLTYKRADGKKENNHSIPLTRPVLMAEASLPIDPYFLGQWLADGDSNMLAITTMDPETAAFIHNTGATNGLDVVVSNNGSAANRYALVSKVKASNGRGMVGRNPLSDIFRSLGLFDQKHIPQNYLWASVDQRLSLLQGLMDADGGCYRNRCEFNNTNEALSRGVYQLAASLGLKPYWSVKRATLYGKDCGACYRVTWTGALGVFRLPRKLKELPAKPKSCQNHRIITSVEPEGVQEVRCITVENPDGLFLFGHNFNVTHNSQLVSAIAAYKLYKLLNIRSPQEYYGLVPSSPIDFTFMAQDSEGASRLYDKMKEDVNRAPFFAPFLKSMNTEEMAFVSEADRGKRDVTPSIKVASFPCLEENELVWSTNGLQPIKDIQVGDHVLDMQGVPQRVTAKANNEERLLALSTQSFKGDPLLLTPKHTCISVKESEAFSKLPFLFKWKQGDRFEGRKKARGIGKKIDITEGYAEELAIGDYLLFPQLNTDNRNCNPLDNAQAKTLPWSQGCLGGGQALHTTSACRRVPELPVTLAACRLYGLFLAEGSTSGRTYLQQARWTFHIDEQDTYAKFVHDTLLSEFGLDSRVFTEKDANKCVVTCCSSELARGLAHWFGRGSDGKVIPTEALSWPLPLQKALIQGYYEGDGSDDRRIAPTVSKRLAYSLYSLIIQTGQHPSILFRPGYNTLYKGKVVVHKDSWYTEICRREGCARFFQEIDGVNYYWTRITEIDSVESAHKVVDISVENTNSFLTKFAAVHNCTTGSVRGPSSFLLALDEFGFYRAQIGSSSDEIYKAAAPATMQFKAGGTRDGKRESMILIITSPNGKIGKYYSLYQSGMKMGNKSDILAFRCSTAEMNPRSDVDFLKKEFRESPDVFQAEYGGNFLEAAESYVKLSTIGECVDLTRGNVTSFETRMVGQKNFWGLDLGMQHDGTGLAICHWEPLGNGLGAKLVYDVIDRLMVGEHPYENVKQLPLDDVLEWLRLKNDLLPCHKGATDQHGGSMLVQLLQNYGINGLDLVHLTSGINSQMYLVFKGLLEQKKISLPNEERFLSELKLVEASYSGKYQIRVQAPAEKDAHDDMCDASALASWVAQQWALGEGSREFADICDGWSPANFTAGLPNSGLDVQTASMAELKSYERQLALMQKINSGVQNPYRRR